MSQDCPKQRFCPLQGDFNLPIDHQQKQALKLSTEFQDLMIESLEEKYHSRLNLTLSFCFKIMFQSPMYCFNL